MLTAAGAEPWLMVSKAPILPAPPVPEDVGPYLRTGVTDPEQDPALADDFDAQFPDDPAEAARLQELLRGYVAGPWRAWAPQARTALQARKLYEDLYDLRQRLQRDSAQYELVWGHGHLDLDYRRHTDRSSAGDDPGRAGLRPRHGRHLRRAPGRWFRTWKSTCFRAWG